MMSEAAMYYPPMSSDFEKLSSPLLFERPPCPKWIRNTALERLNCPKWVLAIRNTALERLNCPKFGDKKHGSGASERSEAGFGDKKHGSGASELSEVRNTALERLNCPKWLLSAASISASYLLVQPTWLLRFVQWCYPSVFFLKSTTEPFVALTIDDAPHVNITPEILNILKDHGCKATFFAIGENLDNDAPDRPLFTRMCKEGHEVANHTMRDFPSWRLSREELRKELSETDRRIRPIGKDPTVQDLKWFRPGHGFFNEGMIAEAEAQGYRVALGSIYPWDTLFTAQGSLLSQSILRRIHPGAVIVLHDREPQKEQTLQILKTILPELKAKGYHVVTLSHLHSLTSPPVTISSSSESDIVMKTGTQRWSWCQRVSMNVVMDTVKETFTRWWSRFQQVSMTVVMGNGDSKRDIYSKVV
ncbi:hypothetical protein MARPO_0016s0107 [Marchantia polymorpha]|uniref:NodB homology domain-containing protein n=1 Tax=Marchantia polymorpha TaxID=3197 RepID=A0A2R6XG20_MARPO|nr:hypothetical protein MARPO_0016s0107 [Marchantia polymorpha]|eukprot:PTQ45054.1 hypothetical protein MARPO_0016s0107 [Marchantia polymorpha]